jgi:hypothetical protein
VNQGDKLTAARKKEKIAENRVKYGLSEDTVKELKLPNVRYLVQIYSIPKIMHPKSKMTTVEKINYLAKLQEALKNKLERLENQRKEKSEH